MLYDFNSLEHNVNTKIQNYMTEAHIWRQLPKSRFRKRFAQSLRQLADRLEPQSAQGRLEGLAS